MEEKTFQEELKQLIEKHFGEIAKMKEKSLSRRTEVFLQVYYEALVPLFQREFATALQILEGEK